MQNLKQKYNQLFDSALTKQSHNSALVNLQMEEKERTNIHEADLVINKQEKIEQLERLEPHMELARKVKKAEMDKYLGSIIASMEECLKNVEGQDKKIVLAL